MDKILAHNKENKSANFGDTSESSQVFPEIPAKSQLITLACTIYRDQDIDMAYKNSANISKELQDRLIRATMHGMVQIAFASPFHRSPISAEISEMVKSLVIKRWKKNPCNYFF